MTLSQDQEAALNKLKEWSKSKEPYIVLSGVAGCGKTTVTKYFLDYLNEIGTDYKLCAPTHKAKSVLEKATDDTATTLHSMLAMSPNIEIFDLDYNDLKFLCGDSKEIPYNGIVIVDECSMITDDLFNLLIDKCKPYKTKILFIGDSCQIRGVNNGDISAIFKLENIIYLTEIHRQDPNNGLLPLLKTLRNNKLLSFNNIEASTGSLFVYRDAKSFIKASLPLFKEACENRLFNHVKIIAYTNKRVQGFNDVIRKCLWNDDVLYHKNEFITAKYSFDFGVDSFYNSVDYFITDVKEQSIVIPNYKEVPGYNIIVYDPIFKQDRNFSIISKNIDTKTLLELGNLIEETRLEAMRYKQLGNRTIASRYWRDYYSILNSFTTPFDLYYDNRTVKPQSFDYGYAATVYKVQGDSLDSIFVDMNNLLKCKDDGVTREMQYVALSRTKNDAYILV